MFGFVSIRVTRVLGRGCFLKVRLFSYRFITSPRLIRATRRVFRAVDYSIGMVAACKVVSLNSSTSQGHKKELHKEIKVHSQLKHDNILRFLGSLIIEDDRSSLYVPAVYMVMEFASGGDLFDKIGAYVCLSILRGYPY